MQIGEAVGQWVSENICQAGFVPHPAVPYDFSCEKLDDPLFSNNFSHQKLDDPAFWWIFSLRVLNASGDTFEIQTDSPMITLPLRIVHRQGRVKIKNIVGHHIPE
jgi:hypothetical protein